MSIRIFSTGGTIDKIHDPITESLIFTDRSHIADMLDVFQIPDVKFTSVMLKDSLNINDNDRQSMVDAIRKCDEKMIILTHGTSTMPETAQYLAPQINDKVIVITGAMRPYSLFQSDSEFNLGCAISAVRILDTGVYITMNGQIFSHADVSKNTKLGIFEKINR